MGFCSFKFRDITASVALNRTSFFVKLAAEHVCFAPGSDLTICIQAFFFSFASTIDSTQLSQPVAILTVWDHLWLLFARFQRLVFYFVPIKNLSVPVYLAA